MHMLRGLADDGRTVIVVTHSVAQPRRLRPAAGARARRQDRLLRAARGRARLLRLRSSGRRRSRPSSATRTGTGRASTATRRSTGSTSPTDRSQPRLPPAAARSRVAPPPKPQSWGAQLGTLVRRYAAALGADRTFLAIMIALPFVMGAMARALGRAARLDPGRRAMNALLILCVGGVPDRRGQRRARTGQGTRRSTSANEPSACPDRRT